LSIIRTVIAALLLGVALPAAALAQTGEFIGSMRQQQEEVRPRGIEHELSLEQSRVNARSASELQRRQTRRDVEVTEQRLRTFKTQSPHAPPIPLLERRLDRVSRPTGTPSRDPGLESGFDTSLGLSRSIPGG